MELHLQFHLFHSIFEFSPFEFASTDTCPLQTISKWILRVAKSCWSSVVAPETIAERPFKHSMQTEVQPKPVEWIDHTEMSVLTFDVVPLEKDKNE